MRPRIDFADWELKKIAEDTGLSRLEVMGVMQAMNKFTSSPEAIRAAEARQREWDRNPDI